MHAIRQCVTSYSPDTDLSGPVYRGANATALVRSDEGLAFVEYSSAVPAFDRWINYRDQALKIYRHPTLRKPSEAKGKLVVRDENGQEVEFEPELMLGILAAVNFGSSGDWVAYVARDYLKKFKPSVIVCNLRTGEWKSSPAGLEPPKVIDDCIYGWMRRERRFVKLSLAMQTVWSTDFGQLFKAFGQYGSRIPKSYKDKVICYLGSGAAEVEQEDRYTKARFLEGQVCSFDKEDGSITWNRKFDWALEDMVLVGDTIYACTQWDVLCICARTGEVKNQATIPLRAEHARSGLGFPVSALAVWKSLVFLCYERESRIWVYDAESLTVKHEIQLPTGRWYGRDISSFCEITQRLYVSLGSCKTVHFEFNSGAVLEIDPTHYSDAVEVEEGPNVEVSLRPAPAEPEKEELWVEITCPSLDDALRFGEWHTQNQTWRQADISFPAFEKEVNPKFNGRVHFVYSGSSMSAETVRSKLQIMEQRFDQWIEEQDFRSGDGERTPCSLRCYYKD